ncbi:MAG: anti-sigma regulatory factor [Firmicutes bacterium]|uniref:Serine/threonine-protein kinase RsbT n=1 Tax=Melghirimyces thermohalophilus TaxID=1236220 RepID=A0A1G6IGB1_9BACL|nr:anti-sigma regulatory factor [Melghirimyces thermohalophilus]MDA8351809.1 anti-sigma regulatory factor [Bacillota bacterium]SDC05440.1 serine/threonine-protein kinase RsbT [Melghirimyces thermohalophilus]
MNTVIPIKYEWDVVNIRSKVREMAKEMGFSELDQSRIVQSVSELARNVVHHAEEGVVRVESIEGDKPGIRIVVQDFGPGIEDLDEVIRASESLVSTEGYGLRQVRDLMDDFAIRALEGKGTCVQVTKWLNAPAVKSEE